MLPINKGGIFHYRQKQWELCSPRKKAACTRQPKGSLHNMTDECSACLGKRVFAYGFPEEAYVVHVAYFASL